METTIPQFDLADLGGGAAAGARALRAAFAQFGFVGVTGHGVAPALVDRAFAAARAFFGLPLAARLACELPGSAGQRGYTRLGVEKAKDQVVPDRKEFFHVGREAPAGDPRRALLQPNVWPRELPEFEPALCALFAALEGVGRRLLAALEPALALPAGWFDERVREGDSILRAIHYPPVDGGAGGVRAAAHEDIDVLTLLVGSHEPGLEIRARDGRWIAVTTLPGTLVVNVGDMLQRLTNGLLPSTTHRVVDPPPPWDARSRWSMPFFLHFAPDVEIRTLRSCVTPDTPDRFPLPITARAYLLERLREIGLHDG